MVLSDHLVLLGGEGESLPGRETKHNEPPGARALVPSTIHVGLSHCTIRVVAQQGRHRTQEVLGHVNVDLGVVPLALLRRPGGSRVEAPDDLAHAALGQGSAVGVPDLGRYRGDRHEPAGDVPLRQLAACELSADSTIHDHENTVAKVGEFLEIT